jgi:ABC-type nitrate/sulfonate/bicarbonate transport system ATPase subunit
MVTVERLSFAYGPNQGPVLNNVTFQLPKGGILCLIGPSGCGKTTLLFTIAGLRKPQTGRVVIDGEVVEKPRKGTAMIFQHFGLLPWKTVFDNVALGLRIREVAEPDIRHQVQTSLGRFGILHLASKYPKHLSGGEKQRVAIARALVLKPDLLLLDEPFSAIDALTRESLQEFLLRVWKGWDLTMIHVTHDIEEAVFLGTEIAVIGRDGGINKTYTFAGEKEKGFRDSALFHEATSTLREYMQGIIDETAR